jgi:hypothetical protein
LPPKLREQLRLKEKIAKEIAERIAREATEEEEKRKKGAAIAPPSAFLAKEEEQIQVISFVIRGYYGLSINFKSIFNSLNNIKMIVTSKAIQNSQCTLEKVSLEV